MSTRLAKRLVEPDYWTCPHGNHVRPEPFLTYGPEVADLCARADFEPDAQQELGLDLIFAIRPDGSPASFAGCVICCRQNLKTGLFKQAAIGWMYVTEEPTMVWSAHEMSTTTDAQRDLENLITSKPFLSKRLAPGITNGIFYGSLGQRIEFESGQQILFKARTNSGGRGLARRKLILDEAFALNKAMMGAFMPVLMAQENAQVLYGSSAGKADSEVLLDVRERGRHGKSPRLFYLEWLAPKEACADQECEHPKDALSTGVDCALDREHLLRKANPALSTGRITLERLRDLRQEMPPEEYARECLGWWDEPDEVVVPDQYFTVSDWAPAAKDVTPNGPPVFFVTMAKQMESASIAVAAMHNGVPHVEFAEHLDGTAWLTARLVELHGRHPSAPIAAFAAGPVKAWAPTLAVEGVELVLINGTEASAGYAHIKKLAEKRSFTHSLEPDEEGVSLVSDSLAGCVWKEAEGGGQTLDWRKSSGDVSPFAAVAGALWVLESRPPQVFFASRR